MGSTKLVRDYMREDFARVSEDTSLYEILRRMNEEEIEFFVITEFGKPASGIITHTDILNLKDTDKINGGGETQAIARDLISGVLIAVDRNDTMDEATELLDRYGIEQVIVTHRFNVVGVITKRECIRWLADKTDPTASS